MSSSNYPLRNSGIYRNLPTFDPSLKDLKALICGGSGISGFHALRVLLESPERWGTIYVLTRSGLPDTMEAFLTPEQKKKIHYVSADLAASSDEIASKLKEAKVQVDYIFFFSYMNPQFTNAMDPNSAKEIYKLNAPLLGNLIDSLPKAAIQPKRICLQTGGKNYGMHVGRLRNPIMESNVEPKHLQPYQFYYKQNEQLFDYCAKHPETSWNIVRPGPIIGSTNKTWLNSMYPFAVYAAVQAHKGEALKFGGDFESWQYPFRPHDCAEWAVLEESAVNQDFNAVDGGTGFSFDRFFHELSRWYGVEKGVELPKLDEDRTFDKTMILAGGKDAPLGYGPPMRGPMEFTLTDWAREPENQKAWKEIMEKTGVDFDPFASDDDIENTFLGDYCYMRLGVLCNDKARAFGFTGHVSSVDTTFEMFEECAKMGMLPEMKTKEPKTVGVSM